MDVLAVFQKTNQKKIYYFRSKEPFEAFFLPLMCTCIANKTDHEIHLVWRRLAVGLGGVGANGDFVRSASSLRSFPDQGHMSAVEEKGGGGQWWLSLPPILSLPLSPSFISQKQNSRVGLSWSALRETSGWRAHEWRRVAGVPLVT